jgi:1,4-alpha-glucan branching enzyme
VILEHFCDPENKDLAAEGMKVWRNLNGAYRDATKGKSSNFSGLYTEKDIPFGTYVGYMESHDEERMGYDQTTVSDLKNDLELRMKRLALNAAFFFTVPGPKMIWQFGEFGYDISIEQNGRTGRKPFHWEYLDVPERKQLHDTYAALIGFRRENPEFFKADAEFSWSVKSSAHPLKTIQCSAAGKTFHVYGNFGSSVQTVTIPDGTWKNYLNDSVVTGSVTLREGEYILIKNF